MKAISDDLVDLTIEERKAWEDYEKDIAAKIEKKRERMGKEADTQEIRWVK